MEAEYGVVVGKPHWRIYQSRVLGPYIVQGLSHFFSSQINAHAFFSIVTLAIAGLLAWRLGSRLGGGGTNAALLGSWFSRSRSLSYFRGRGCMRGTTLA